MILIPSDNIERYMNNFLNRVIVIKRGIRGDVNAFETNTLVDEMGWSSTYNMKKPIYPTLIRMFYANMRITI
jgi:hypothetical protein